MALEDFEQFRQVFTRESEREALEERYGDDGDVATGFAFKFEIQDDPPRVLFQAMSTEGRVILRLWFEIEQFAQFFEIVQQVAADSGCLD